MIYSVSDTSTCQTTDYKMCKFPFEFKGSQYYDCQYGSTEDGSESRWCPLNDEKDKKGNFKSTGLCSENCPGSKANF